MNKNLIIAVSIVGILLFSSSVLASVSTVSTSLSTTRATTGTSVTATTTVTATGSESGSIQLVCTPSGTSISDPSSGQYQGVSLSTTPTSKAFTFTAGTANTYTCNGQSGGISDIAPPTIVFVDPSALTVTGSPTSKTVNASDTFSLTANLQNPQSSAITTSYKLTCSSGYSASGDSSCDETKIITVSAGTTTALAWTITAGSSSGTVSLTVGDKTGAFSTSVTVSSTSTTTTTTTSDTTAGGGGGVTAAQTKVTTQKGKATITIPSIAVGKSATVDINKTEDVAISKIVIDVKNSVNNIQVVVAKIAGKPASITQEVSGKIYHYIEINKTNITDASINKTTIRFKVEKTWLTTNNINDSTVALYRFSDNSWNKLETTKMGEISGDTENIYYEAASPGLSVFAISGEAKAVAPAVTPAPTEQPAQPPAEEKKELPTALVPTKGRGLLITIIVVVVMVAGVVFYLVKKNIIKLPIKKKSNWDALKEKYSRR